MIINEKYILWDWNGTLLDDAVHCLNIMNQLLAKRNMPAIDLAKYKSIFGFPVIDYYRQLGFNFEEESFESLSVEFIGLYNSSISSISLMPEAGKVLKFFSTMGSRQVIVSAMQLEMLLETVLMNKIDHYFTDILGIDNIYAHGKTQLAKDFVRKNNILPTEMVFIGDTLHDLEVANAIGCRCILIASGHQSLDRLQIIHHEVVGSITDLLNPSERLPRSLLRG